MADHPAAPARRRRRVEVPGVRDPAEGRRRRDREAKAAGRLAGLPWCPALGPYHALGFGFSVRVMDAALHAYLSRALRTLAGEGPSAHMYSIVDHGAASRQRYSLYLDGLRIIRTPAPSIVLSYLFWHLNRSAIRENGGYLLIHASAAASGDRAVLLPAPMESGKTTLVSGLLRRGLSYVTDEAVAIDPRTLLVHPYAKPLSIDHGSWTVLADLEPQVEESVKPYLSAQWHVTPTAVRESVLAGLTRPRLIVSPRYAAGAETVLEPMSRAKGVLALADNSFNFPDHGGPGLQTLADVVRGCRCYRLTSSSLDEACDAVLGLLAEDPGE